jgi:hypothetical protein
MDFSLEVKDSKMPVARLARHATATSLSKTVPAARSEAVPGPRVR